MECRRIDGPNEAYVLYRFEVTDGEAIHRIWECVSKANPELKERHIVRSRTAREYVASYLRSDGESVRVAFGSQVLKGFFGAFVLGFTERGITFTKRLPRRASPLSTVKMRKRRG